MPLLFTSLGLEEVGGTVGGGVDPPPPPPPPPPPVLGGVVVLVKVAELTELFVEPDLVAMALTVVVEERENGEEYRVEAEVGVEES